MISPASTRRFLLPVRLVLTLMVGVYVFGRVDWPTLASSFANIRLREFTVAVVLQLAAAAAATSRWRKLMALGGIPLSWLATFRRLIVAIFFSLFFLGVAGGDSARFAGALRFAPNLKAQLAASILGDRLLGIGALLAILSGLFVTGQPRLWATPGTRAIVLVVLAGTTLYWASLLLVRLAGVPLPTISDSSKRLSSRQVVGAIRRQFALDSFPVLFGLSLANHALNMASAFFVALSLGISLPPSSVASIFGILALFLSLPLTFAGLGVRDGLVAWLFLVFGVHSPAVTAFSFCLLGINLLWGVAGGITFLAGSRD